MIENQLIARNITDKNVLDAISKIPREKFIPIATASSAYDDRAIPIGFGQTISQPYMVAVMTQLLELEPEHTKNVLEIGTGSGYQTAILATIVKRVYSVERTPELSARAGEMLKQLKISNVHLRIADGTLGWEEFAPYDRIIVTAGSPDVPTSLIAQLAEDGIMVIPIGPMQSQVLIRLRKKGTKILRESVLECRFVKLIGTQGWKG